MHRTNGLAFWEMMTEKWHTSFPFVPFPPNLIMGPHPAARETEKCGLQLGELAGYNPGALLLKEAENVY